MIQAIIGKKQDQSQLFLEDGTRMSVTKISVPANAVIQVKNPANQAWVALQLGFGTRKKATKAIAGHVKKAGHTYVPAFFREIRVAADSPDALPKAGDMIALADVLKPGDVVQVTGTSKGKGFAGGVKRHGFHGGPRTHGQSDRERAPGSIGQATTPGRVYKGKKMAGRMGHETVTVSNLVVLDIDNETLYIKGLVPGGKNSIVVVAKTGESKKFVPVYKTKAASNAVEVKDRTEEATSNVANTEETHSTDSASSLRAGSGQAKEDKEDGGK